MPKPTDLNEEDIVFSTRRVVPCGYVSDIRYVVFVSPEGYYALPDEASWVRLRGAIGVTRSTCWPGCATATGRASHRCPSPTALPPPCSSTTRRACW